MLTTIIVGNRFTRRKREFIYTPRGYNSWEVPETAEPSAVVTEPSVWVFSGTSDGNTLAAELARSFGNVIVSTATEYGKEAALNQLSRRDSAGRTYGSRGAPTRTEKSNATILVDATHPFATEISSQLMELAGELQIPYLRFERPETKSEFPQIDADTMDSAAGQSVKLGRRIFLATGSKDLPCFLQHTAEWFVRVAPEPASLERAISLGIPRAHICAMQGPFTTEFNEALWRSWKIECVVTKESGEAGGFTAKAEAAARLQIPMIVVRRPVMNYPVIAHDPATALSLVSQLINRYKSNP